MRPQPAVSGRQIGPTPATLLIVGYLLIQNPVRPRSSVACRSCSPPSLQSPGAVALERRRVPRPLGHFVHVHRDSRCPDRPVCPALARDPRAGHRRFASKCRNRSPTCARHLVRRVVKHSSPVPDNSYSLVASRFIRKSQSDAGDERAAGCCVPACSSGLGGGIDWSVRRSSSSPSITCYYLMEKSLDPAARAPRLALRRRGSASAVSGTKSNKRSETGYAGI